MKWYKDTLQISTSGKGLNDFTQQAQARLQQWDVGHGMCFLYVPHTSASLVISESYDSTARVDLEAFMERLAPENQPWHYHSLEGGDDSPSHMRAMVTNTSLDIPVENGKLCLGRWQGIYLFEHRRREHRRQVLIRCLSVDSSEVA
jgi:secondary thiamine-phosphate synthase enzyme